MDPLVAAYLETIAVLSMSFIGFSAIVILLRQSDGRKLSAWDAFVAHVYMENGLIAIVGALLPPLFEFWQLSSTAAFRLASGFMARSGIISLRRNGFGASSRCYPPTHAALLPSHHCHSRCASHCRFYAGRVRIFRRPRRGGLFEYSVCRLSFFRDDVAARQRQEPKHSAPTGASFIVDSAPS
jgi:hypothetical protein